MALHQSHWKREFNHAQALAGGEADDLGSTQASALLGAKKRAGARRSRSHAAPQGSQRAARRRRGRALLPPVGSERPARESARSSRQQTHQHQADTEQSDPSG